MTRNEVETILKDYNADETKATIDKLMDIHGKGVQETKSKMQGEIDEAKNTIQSLKDELANADNGDLQKQLDEAKKKISEYETAEQKRLEAEKKAEADKAWADKIDPLFDSANIKNDKYTRQGLSADIRKAFEAEGNTKGISEILADLTKDNDDYKVNPQQQKITLPGTKTKTDNDSDAIAKAREIMGLKPKE